MTTVHSPISPRSPQTSDELFAFEGVDALVQAWRDGLTPDPALNVSEWADRHRFLSPRASAEPGRYRTDRTPYMRAIMDALSPGNAARRIVFVDSITVLSRLCLTWAKAQPQAFSDRTGKPDTRGAYGLLGTEMIAALTHLQHARDKNVIFVAILDERLDDFNRRVFVPQIEGSKTALELPGIVDEVVTLAELKTDEGELYRAFVCQTLNPWGYPAKDRSGRLDLVEEPNLLKLIRKCAGDNAAIHH